MRKQVILMFSLLLATCGLGQVSVTHNLPQAAAAGETIDAQFTVSKGTIGSFAKFQCDVPSGTQAVAGDTKAGNFTFENNRFKIVWVSLPSEETFTFSVKLTLSGSASSQSFTGQFYYLENNVKKEAAMPAHTISISGATAGSGTSDGSGTTTTTPTETTSSTTPTETTSTSTPTETTSTTPTETVTSTTPTETTTSTTPTETTTSTTPTETVSGTGTSTTTGGTGTSATGSGSSSRPGVTYYVQVAALSADPGLTFKKYGKMKVVVESGLYKVLIGSYGSLEEARKRKGQLIGQGLVGSFVVAYENGVRVKL